LSACLCHLFVAAFHILFLISWFSLLFPALPRLYSLTLHDALPIFSSLAATREWLSTDMAKRFMRAYRKARAWLIATPAAKVAETESAFFPEIDRAVLASTIAYYQKLGCWTPHLRTPRPPLQDALPRL